MSRAIEVIRRGFWLGVAATAGVGAGQMLAPLLGLPQVGWPAGVALSGALAVAAMAFEWWCQARERP